MKYIKVIVMYGVPDEEWQVWDTRGDMNFSAWHLHKPQNEQYVVEQEVCFTTAEDAEKLKYSFFTEEGGI